ncbi:MAG TPA: S8 family peptidase [Thermoanaerobaculia bacterium]|jgi:hypothetical protein|nr:S8 family peptidase [Thermoanaerobaculia bacterium]
MQANRLRPQLNRLRATLQRGADRLLELRADPEALAPERVIVFEIAGTVDAFARALQNVPGFELLLETDIERPADDLFAERDNRQGREGRPREDKGVGGRLYLAMPDMAALEQLVSLWERWEAGQPLPHGLTAFRDVFLQLRTLRPWGPQDRISDETMAYWREEHQRHPDRSIRMEVELWFRRAPALRDRATRAFHAAVAEVSGAVIDEAIIPEIAYHGILVDVPAAQVAALIEGQRPAFALLDEVMFLRPQTVMSAREELEIDDGPPPLEDTPAPAIADPIVALLDGVPVQGHQRLVDRLMLDDPDDLQGQAVLARRVHGTAMASLIVHGDLNIAQPPLSRLVYVRPLMIAPEDLEEHTPGERLLVDVLYQAILRIKGTPGTTAVAPAVFIVNLSIGDPRRPFANIISPLARLIDYLAASYSILFLVSAGNIRSDLTIPDFDQWADFENALPEQRERAVLAALNAAKHERSLLSPAESINALTIGSQHFDNVAPRPPRGMAVDPFDDSELANTSCALGLGYKRAVKPELFFPGGREYLHMAAAGGGVRARIGRPHRLYGLKTAAPDGGGRLNLTAHTGGTSAATALGSRAGHLIFDALMDRDGGSTLADIPPDYYAVAIKTLLVHSARWNSKGELLKDICGPADTRRWQERAANAARFLGFGIPDISRVLDCAENQATLVGYGTIHPEEAQRYRIPLPPALEGVTDPRTVTVTVTWLSPVRAGHQSYRAIRLEAQPVEPALAVGVGRASDQPADGAIKRGTVFHERYTGERAVPFVDDGHLSVDVWCKEDADGGVEPVRYAIAITIEAGTPLPVYEQVQQRLRVRAAPQA